MKNISLQLLLLTSLLFSACKSEAQKVVGATGNAQVEVIDFYSTHRCVTCIAIENIARNVVETDFAAELKAGKIVFKTVNVDDANNLKIAEKFEASGTALFVYNGKTGQALDLTDAGFSYAKNDESKLRGYLQTAIRNNLSQLK
jgi:thiol-disulfide isomerase/thioredoxin